MPEGPEIRRAADQIERILVGQPIVDVEFGLPRLQRFRRKLEGRKVVAVETRGKAILTRFENELTLYSHNQLYGLWYTTRRPGLPTTTRSLRVALHTQTHSALLYSASDIEVLTPAQVARHPFLSRIGPDILDGNLDQASVLNRLVDKRFINRSTGALYLDQAFLAGNGNYLRSEILHVARIHPGERPADLEESRLSRLARQTLAISRRSYRTHGITVVPTLDRSLKADGLDYEQRRFYVFGRAGEPCHSCGTGIRALTVSGRRFYLCPSCQPEPAGPGRKRGTTC